MASSKREKELARQRAERQAARRAAAAARRKQRNAVVASVLAVVLVAGAAIALTLATQSGGEDELAAANPEASAEPSPSASPLPPGSCLYTPTTDPASKPAPLPPAQDVEDEQAYTATLSTSQGPIVLELDSAAAPCTVNSFVSLAQAGYFADTSCHRLVTGGTTNVLQCGDPSATSSGGPGYEFAEENLEGATYPKGTVAMANAGPGTNGSQFFLVYADTTLSPDYTPFGTITAGLDVLEKVAAAGSDGSLGAGQGKPTLPVQITAVEVAPKTG